MLLMDRTFSLHELSTVVTELLRLIKDIKIITLEGDLGAGKTTLVREICRQCGVKDTVGSPTFSIVNEYLSSDGVIYHIDLYRLVDEEEAYRAGLEDQLFSGARCLVEWPQRASGILPDERIRFVLSVIDEGHRRIEVYSREK